mmetsp:Transcript_63060/g.149420  ORF Transcript_63060/g.149420 Transcript_63060/m.149420 type:complete len:275 (+) Transcript_63060:780-1604(+)
MGSVTSPVDAGVSVLPSSMGTRRVPCSRAQNSRSDHLCNACHSLVRPDTITGLQAAMTWSQSNPSAATREISRVLSTTGASTGGDDGNVLPSASSPTAATGMDDARECARSEINNQPMQCRRSQQSCPHGQGLRQQIHHSASQTLPFRRLLRILLEEPAPLRRVRRKVPSQAVRGSTHHSSTVHPTHPAWRPGAPRPPSPLPPRHRLRPRRPHARELHRRPAPLPPPCPAGLIRHRLLRGDSQRPPLNLPQPSPRTPLVPAPTSPSTGAPSKAR